MTRLDGASYEIYWRKLTTDCVPDYPWRKFERKSISRVVFSYLPCPVYARKPDLHSKLHDGLIARLEQHEDSVYAVDWSPVDPWYFASVSYDGNLLINQVPEPVKMHILLQPKSDDADATEE